MKRLFLIPLTLIVLIRCSNMEQEDIIGNYKIGKFVIRDTLVNGEDFSVLSLKDDSSFELKNYHNSNKVIGKWERLSSLGTGDIQVQFSFQDKKITGVLKGTIFHFDFPNDLYNGKYESILYVRLTK